jgi:hypothetical protein
MIPVECVQIRCEWVVPGERGGALAKLHYYLDAFEETWECALIPAGDAINALRDELIAAGWKRDVDTGTYYKTVMR